MRVSPAFQTTSARPPVDLALLASQTGNDQALEKEVLRLYIARAPIDFVRLRAVASANERRQIAHLMTGSARAIGAAEVARLASAIEQRPNADAHTIAALGAAVAEARRFISAHLEASPAPP